MAEIKNLIINGKTYAIADTDAINETQANAIALSVAGDMLARSAVMFSGSQNLNDSQKTQARANIGAADHDYVNNNFANALKGTVTGNPVCITDSSPVEHEVAVSIDAQGGTVKKLGKNLVNVDAMLSSGLTKDENGIYHITGISEVFSFDIPIPANTPVTITLVDLEGYNANSDALLRLSEAYESGSAGPINWFGVSGNLTNKVTLTNNSAFLRFAILPYSPSEDYWCEFSGVQVEIGETATEYEPYKEPIAYTADENGIVEGIVGSGEAMTLLADSGATITAEYNRDTNKVIAAQEATISELKAALTALLEG